MYVSLASIYDPKNVISGVVLWVYHCRIIGEYTDGKVLVSVISFEFIRGPKFNKVEKDQQISKYVTKRIHKN